MGPNRSEPYLPPRFSEAGSVRICVNQDLLDQRKLPTISREFPISTRIDVPLFVPRTLVAEIATIAAPLGPVSRRIDLSLP